MMKKASKKPAPAKNRGRTTKQVPAKKNGNGAANPDPSEVRLLHVPDRKDAEFNAAAIRTAFLKIVNDKGRKPTFEELAAATGLHKATVSRHVQRLKFVPESSVYRVLSDDVILAIYQGAVKGSSRDKKLWLQLFEGFAEKTEIDPAALFNLGESRRIEKTMNEDEAAALYHSQVTGRGEDD